MSPLFSTTLAQTTAEFETLKTTLENWIQTINELKKGALFSSNPHLNLSYCNCVMLYGTIITALEGAIKAKMNMAYYSIENRIHIIYAKDRSDTIQAICEVERRVSKITFFTSHPLNIFHRGDGSRPSGAATSIISHLKREADETGLPPICASVPEPSIGFYIKAGFTVDYTKRSTTKLIPVVLSHPEMPSPI